MNRILKLTLSIAMMVFLSLNTVSAQKFGYLNSQQLLVEFPEVASADKNLETYQKQLLAKGETMVKAFETEYKAYMDMVNNGTLSKVQMQQKEGQLTSKQQEIQKYEVEVQEKLLKKREELYKPILDKVQSAIDAIGKDEGYTMIFDTSTGALLHAVDSEDITSKVKSRLGF